MHSLPGPASGDERPLRLPRGPDGGLVRRIVSGALACRLAVCRSPARGWFGRTEARRVCTEGVVVLTSRHERRLGPALRIPGRLKGLPFVGALLLGRLGFSG